MTLSEDDRALAFNIALFFATILMGFFLYVVIEPAASPLLSVAGEHTTRASAAKGQSYIQAALDSSHILVVGMGVLQLLAAAVYESRVAAP